MLEDSSKQRRRRIDRIANVLRQFGVADPGDIVDVLGNPPLPPLATLEKKIRSLELRLPPNVSPKFVAEALLASVAEESPARMRWRDSFGPAPNLKQIKPGAAQAAKYHREVFKALVGIFDGCLDNGKIEREINRGIHRVDIMFDNKATEGFFADVRTRLSLPSNYVPIECKNYKDDLNSPEYDQLSGRLNKDIGRLGILVFRQVTDANKALEHLRAKWAKGELLIMLDDADVLRMHKTRLEGKPEAVDAILWEKVRCIQLNSTK